VGKNLFIAEKPSVAREFANALKYNMRSKDGYLESEEAIVTWCVGHLVTMSYPEVYDEKFRRWSFDTLPFLPTEFKYEVIESAKKQYTIVSSLLNRVNLGKQKQAAEKNVEYIVDWEQSDIRHMDLAGNPIYVERLLTNISDNAVKFTGPGGSVRVWCAEKYADEERVVYEFGCADTGIGMSETFLEHAFEPFTQENETSRSRYEGTGLGLAIAKKIVDRLDGDIAIESKKGVGTTVTMTLPFKIGEPVEKEKNVNYEEIPVEGLRALLAEDNELNMEITKFMLEDYGIHVECAADGEEAVQKFKNLSWDITM
jgi:CheY-like chemotaxis protein